MVLITWHRKCVDIQKYLVTNAWVQVIKVSSQYGTANSNTGKQLNGFYWISCLGIYESGVGQKPTEDVRNVMKKAGFRNIIAYCQRILETIGASNRFH